MISVRSHLQFIQFLSLHLLFTIISPTMSTVMKYAFLNGVNMIRCSEDQLQVYQSDNGLGMFVNQELTCSNKKTILDDNYSGLIWDRLTLHCMASGTDVREEQNIYSRFGYILHEVLDEIQGQLGRSNTAYPFTIEIKDNDKEAIIRSEEHAIGDPYFIEHGKARCIYLKFMNQPTICRIVFLGDDDSLCDKGKSHAIDDAEYICYTDVDASIPVSAAQLEAELQEIDRDDILDDELAFLVNRKRPTFSPTKWSEVKEDIIKPVIVNSTNGTVIYIPTRPKNKIGNKKKAETRKSNVLKIVGIILVVVVLLALVAGIAFYFLKKQGSNRVEPSGSSSSIHAERGKTKENPAPAVDESEQSLANDDENAGIPIDQQSNKDKPNIATRKPVANRKAQRGGTNMVFNEDG